MAVQREPESAASYPIRCVQCHRDLRDEGWSHGPVVHCRGGAKHVWGVWKNTIHHGHRIILCLACRKRMGCDACIPDLSAALCRECGVFANGEPLADPRAVRAVIEDLLRKF